MTNPLEMVGGIAVGTGVGQAVGDVVKPQLEDFRAEQWGKHPDRRLAPTDVAISIARSIPTDLNRDTEFRQNGIGPIRQALLTQLAREYPGLPLALELWRRGYATQENVRGWLHRAGLSDEIVTQIIGDGPDPIPRAVKSDAGLFWDRLAPAVVATAIQRSIMDDPGFIPAASYAGFGDGLPASHNPAAFPPTTLPPLPEAEDSGIAKERLRVMTALIGLPLSLEQAASAYFRGIISLEGFKHAVAEGNTRIEWGPAALAQARQILTANQYAELELRGFLTASRRRQLTAQHGMSQADSDRLFDVLGRSVNVHQIVTGEARGGTYKPPPATLAQQEAGIPPAFLASLQRGNLRPEYYDIAYHNRYTYPSFFAIRGLLQGGVFASADDGYQILLEMGWKPSLARLVADFYWQGTATTTGVGPLTKSARTQAITEIRSAFLIGQADETQARTWLAGIGVEQAEIDGIIPIWTVMLDVPQRGLTPTQIKKAYENIPSQWPRQRALDELQLLGFTADDAATILDE
jgi:hypothetical protein